MTQDPLNQFTRQLASWAEEYLQRSRSPMRRLDLAPAIATDLGVRRPDLVIWINRDSCMAGGILLVPPRETPEVEMQGRACALALGLRHFVVWGTREIVFWEVLEQGLSCHRTLPAPAAGDDAATFRRALANLLDELKYLTVAGIVPPDKLSPYYLVNLCQGAIEDTLPVLTEVMRVARSEGRQGGVVVSPEVLALDKALLTLVRLAALLHLDQLPPTVQPEGLERAMVFALDTLPPELRRPLLPATAELPLPLEAAVRFHHLLRRLTQLGSCHDQRRSAQLLEFLMALHHPALGLATPELPPESSGRPRLLLNCGRPAAGDADWEVAPASALAASSLLRFLRRQPPALVQAFEPFQLPGSPAPGQIIGSLTATAPIAARERQELLARLRISWPTRRFQLPAELPRWGWELLHLVGLAAAGARLSLSTPGHWLATPIADDLLALVRLECSLYEIAQGEDGDLTLELVKSRDGEEPLVVLHPEGRRTLDHEYWGMATGSILALAVALPSALWSLFENRLLQPAPAGEPATGTAIGVLLFAHSSVGRALWRVLGQGQAMPRRDRLPALFAERRLPLPRRDILDHLQRFGTETPSTLPGQAAIDAELAPWFNTALATGQGTVQPLTPPNTATRARPARTVRDTLRQEVFRDGLPRFPDHYLFAHFRPELSLFRFLPPLERGDEFFGQVTFRDREGQSLTAASPATARALELVAACGREEVRLPSDAVIMADILGRYLQDLQTLYGELQRRAHALVADPRQAQKVVRDLWQEFELPPPALFLAGQI